MSELDLNEITIRMADLLPPYGPHCATGARRWFHQNNLDFESFMRQGISAKALVDTGDHLAINVVRLKLSREV